MAHPASVNADATTAPIHEARHPAVMRAKGGLRADQWLTLQPGGAEVRNVMIIRKFGIAVARLDETIRRVEGAAPVK
jgi:hypothetical protein